MSAPVIKSIRGSARLVRVSQVVGAARSVRPETLDLAAWERVLARTGQLVDPGARAARSAACGSCEKRRASEWPEVWGCSACPACGGGAERMLALPTTCPRGRWLA